MNLPDSYLGEKGKVANVVVEDNLCDPHLVLRTVNGIIVKAAIARAEAPINRAFGVVVFIIIMFEKDNVDDHYDHNDCE